MPSQSLLLARWNCAICVQINILITCDPLQSAAIAWECEEMVVKGCRMSADDRCLRDLYVPMSFYALMSMLILGHFYCLI